MNDGSSAAGEVHGPTHGPESAPRAPAERRAGTTDRHFVRFFLGGQAAQLVTLVVLRHLEASLWVVAALWVVVAVAYWMVRARIESRVTALGGAGVLASFSLVTVMPELGYRYFATALAILGALAATNLPAWVTLPGPAAGRWRRALVRAGGAAALLALAAWWDQ